MTLPRSVPHPKNTFLACVAAIALLIAGCSDKAAESEAAVSESSVESLRARVAALTEENAALRQQVALLQEQLRAHGRGVDQAEDSSVPF